MVRKEKELNWKIAPAVLDLAGVMVMTVQHETHVSFVRHLTATDVIENFISFGTKHIILCEKSPENPVNFLKIKLQVSFL